MRTQPSRLGLLAAVALFAAACQESVESSDLDTRDGVPEVALSALAGTAEAAAGAGAGRALSAADLYPTIRPVGAQGSIPDRIVVEFGPRLVAAGLVGSITEGTVLALEPATAGRLAFSSESTLTFTPDVPLLPGTRYRVLLSSVGTRDGVLVAPSAGAWSYEFRTPAFEAREFAVRQVDLEEHRADFELRFSGPVSPVLAGQLAVVRLEGGKPDGATFSGTDRPDVVLVSVADSGLAEGQRVRIDMQAGLELRGHAEVQLPARSWEADVRVADLVTIVAVRRREGPTGHFVEVVCDDTSAEGWRGWWYDETTSEWQRLSPRCIPQEDSATSAIRIEPALPFSVSSTEHGFRILGDFQRGSYTVTVGSGLLTEDGGRLASTFSTGITVPARSPQVAFESKGRYLPKQAWRKLAVRHLNVDEIRVQVRHIRPENLVFWLSGGDEVVDERTSDRIVDTRQPARGAPDQFATSSIDLARLVPDAGKGIFEVRVEAPGSDDVSRLLVTDMNLVVKRSAGERKAVGTPEERTAPGPVWVWALGMDDNRPLAGVTVDVVRRSGSVQATCTTGKDGGCRLDPKDDPVDPSEPFAVLARNGDDLTYLRFSDLEIEQSEESVFGQPYSVEQPYRMAAWSDRGVYRPGDVAHLAAVLRGRDDRAPRDPVPVELVVQDPNGNTLYRDSLPTNPAGLVTRDVEFADFASTGRWTAAFSVADKEVARYEFHVEEFVPERMRVAATAPQPDLLGGQPVPVDVDAAYLFGGSAAGSTVELSCELRPEPFAPPRNGNFTYGIWHDEDDPAKPISLGVASGEIGPDGKAALSCPGLDKGGGFSGGGVVSAQALVFEAGSGRSTRGETSVRLHPERFHIGLDSGEDMVEAGHPFSVSGIVVDWKGVETQATDKVQIELYRLVEEYGLMFDSDTGTERWRRYIRKVKDGELVATVKDARFAVQVTPTADGAGYLVRAKAGAETTDLELEGAGAHYWWWGEEDTVDETPRPLKPGTLALELPEELEVGKAATFSFVAPYAGRALLTAETDSVLESLWIDVKKAGPVSWTFTPKGFVPNVYVGALLVKDPHLDSKDAFMPARAFATKSVPVRPSRFVREVALAVPREIEPNSVLKVDVDAGSGDGKSWVTVAAVDEGILSLTDFESPDPVDDLFVRRALGVESFETVGWTLLTRPEGTSRQVGGDGFAALGRIQMVKPVALWSGLVELDGDGRATVEIQVPQYRGALRVMAVAVGPERSGSASAQVIVRDPLVLQATTPRFLVGGDRFEMPVFVTNTTAKARDVVVSLDIEDVDMGGSAGSARGEPPVRLATDKSRSLRLAPGESGTVIFGGEAVRPVGAARFRVSAKSDELRSWDELEVPLVPAGEKDRQLHRVEVAAGTTDLRPLLRGWTPTTERSTFWVTSNPFGDAFDHLRWLIQYPYGCIEQTTSTTRPLLYVRRLIDHVDPTLADKGGVDALVEHGIRRVLSMQTASGGLSYWPGDTHPVAWGTAYGVHLLLDARQAGYDVPEGALERALDWLDQAVRDEGEHRYAEAYTQYVLARAGRGRQARIEELLAAYPTTGNVGEAAEQIYTLKAALWLSGDRRWEADLRHPDVSALTDQRIDSWSWYSDRRRRAFMLNVMVDLFGRDPDTQTLANVVADSLRGHSSDWYTTQEVSWGVAGLGKWLKEAASEFSPPELLLGGKPVAATIASEDTSERSWSIYRASEYERAEIRIASKGKGDLFLLVGSEGIRLKSTPRLGGDGLRVERKWLRSDGLPMEAAGNDGTPLELGELLYSVVTLTNTTSERVSNIALVDRFAAGWEIENPRLGGDQVPEFLQTGTEWSADHMDLRDDRVEVFGALGPNETVTWACALRAVTAGEFTVPPVEAEAMYDPRVWARAPGQKVRIAGPWAAVAGAGE